MFLFVTLLALICLAHCRTDGIRVVTTDMKAARLNPVTGELACIAPLNMIPTNCTWDFGEGTRGQTSTIFYMNQTFFFTGQERCAHGLGRTAIFAVMGPWCFESDPPQVRFRPLAGLYNVKTDLMSLNLAWDHTCNIVVLSPNQQDSDNVEVLVNQVSEYDSQQRFQPPYHEQSSCKNECWRKVPGVGVLDFGDFRSSWPSGAELYCGDQCLFHTVEEHVVGGVPQGPRAIIGRSYRSAEVMTNWTDSVQVQTLSWNPFSERKHVSQFIGLGICCKDSWCDVNCADKDGHLVLISFSPKNGFSVLADIGTTDKQSVRLGVEFSPAPWSRDPPQAYVFYENTVLTFDLKMDSNNVVQGAKQSHQSGKVTAQLHLWANPGVN